MIDFSYRPSKNYFDFWDRRLFLRYISRVLNGESVAVKILYAKLCFLSDYETSVFRNLYSDIQSSKLISVENKELFSKMVSESGCFYDWGVRLL